jgi:putative nucleotidyltransferase with HDIG domain
MNLADWAEEIARKNLEIPLPRRWAHSQGVATRARLLAPVLGHDVELVEAAAWLHDIGYAPDLEKTGFHPLDGARYLRDAHHADPLLCSLVAHHSFALVEAAERGLADVLAAGFPLPPNLPLAALTYCDLTTSPDGDRVSITWRLADIRTRYGPEHPITLGWERTRPQVADVVRTILQARCGRSTPAR